MEGAASVVDQFLDAFSRGDVEAAVRTLHPDVYFVPSGDALAPSHGDFSGHRGFRAWWQESMHPSFYVGMTALVEFDNTHVVAEVVMGADVEHGWAGEARACVYTVVDHEICAIEVFARPDDAYRARLTEHAV